MDTNHYQQASLKLKELSRVMKLYKDICRFVVIDEPPLKTTGQRVCEFISDMEIFTVPKTPHEIWNYSPSGELMMIPCWYGFAIEKRNTYRRYLGLQ